MAQASSEQDLSAQALSMYFQTDEAKTIERRDLKQKLDQARRPLRWLARIHAIAALIFYLRWFKQINAGVPIVVDYEIFLGVLTVAFWALSAWAWSNPLPAAITGLLLYTSVIYYFSAISSAIQEASHNKNQAHPPAIGALGIVCLFLLTRSIMSGSRQRRLEIADAQSTPDAPVAMRPGIASAIWLYLFLLSIVVVPRTLAITGQGSYETFVGVQIFMTIVILAWAIASWRIVLPAYKQWPEAKWFAQGMVIAFSTAMLAFVYGRLILLPLHVPVIDPKKMFFDQGKGLGTVIAMVCVWPAIFEEMAFRGVIVPVLHRALTKWETILASGAMFMILHLSVFSIPHLLCLGCALAYVRFRTNSIWPCVLMHFTHNFICLFLT